MCKYGPLQFSREASLELFFLVKSKSFYSIRDLLLPARVYLFVIRDCQFACSPAAIFAHNKW